MPYVAGELVDRLLARVRDPDALGTSRATCRLLLTHLQRIVNCRLGYVVGTLTLATVPYQQIYRVSDPVQAPLAMRMLGVQEGSRNLKKIKWPEFWYMDRAWSRAIGSAFQLWSMIGRDLLVLWPSKPGADSVTLVYAKLTNELTDDTIAIELPDETVPLVLDLAEALICYKQRVYGPITKLAETIPKRLQAS